jgi:hypothetical protein
MCRPSVFGSLEKEQPTASDEVFAFDVTEIVFDDVHV